MFFGAPYLPLLKPDSGELPIVDYVNKELAFIGFAADHTVKKNQDDYLIYRLTNKKGVIEISSLSDSFDQIWDKRFEIFSEEKSSRELNASNSVSISQIGASLVSLEPIQKEILDNILIQLKIINKYLEINNDEKVKETDLK